MGTQLRTVLGQLRRHACREQAGALTDTELLCRYRTRRDEAAFEALVWRHGAMVLAVCRRVAGHEQDAEDAFQAVFLVFARAAGAITRGESVGGWLSRVAGRVARKARARSARHAALPLDEVARTDDDPAGNVVRRELGPVLDEEVGRLPAKYRDAVVLCYLQGRTHQQAARELGWPKGTVATRLARARRLLRTRLSRRGLAPSPAGLAGLVQAGPPRVPLVLDTIERGLVFANGGPAGTDLVPGPVAALTQGALRTMYLRQRLLVTAALVVLGLVVTAAVAVAHHFLGEAPNPARTRQASAPAQAAKKPQPGPNRLLFYRQGHLTLIGPDGKGEKQVSTDRGKFHPGTARLSPDGRRVAFLVDVGEKAAPGFDPRRKIYVRGLDEEEPGTDLGIEGLLFCWSPDARQLVVTDRVRGDDPKEFKFVTRLVDVHTRKQTAVKLPDDQMVTDWSRDGKYFVTSALGGDKEQPTSRLHLVSRDGTQDRALTAAGALAFHGMLSPDGGKILNMAPDPERKGKEFEEKAGLFVLDVRRGKATRVQGQPLNGSPMGYCWSPDGRRIAHTWRLDQGPQAPGQMIESFLIVSDADGSNPVTVATERGDSKGLITLGDPDWR
jgi:RNA polymerase sigma factor (sigma-70 family)